MSSTKKSIPVYEVQRQLGHKGYEPIWAMMYKTRSAMGTRDNKYLLQENVKWTKVFLNDSSRGAKRATKKTR